MANTASDTSGPTDPDLKSHSVIFIAIDDDAVQIGCSCGWLSNEYEAETEARDEFDEHSGGA